MRKFWQMTAAMAVLSVALTACGGSAKQPDSNPGTQPGTQPAPTTQKLSGKVVLSGSTALQPLAKTAADEFQTKNPDVQVTANPGGSFTGLKQVAEGAVDIGMSDVDTSLAPEYKDKLVDHKVCIAPFLFVVHPDVAKKVTNLSKQQYIDIFTGKVTNWKEVGGDDQAITIIGRAPSSGSRATIQQVVLGDNKFTDKAQAANSNGDVRKGVSQTPGAIGYIDLAYLDTTVKALSYDNVAYSEDAIYSGKYPVFAYEHLFTKGEAQGVVKAFIDYMMSPEFAKANLKQVGFVPLTK